MGIIRQEDAGCGDQVGPDGRRYRRYGRPVGPSHPRQTGHNWSCEQVSLEFITQHQHESG